jgi:zona occludens toxin
LVLTTPNIKKIRDDIRGCAEGAYKHKNLALVGIKGHYIEAFHMADDTGVSASDFLSVRRRKIKKHVWGLYDSTATGSHSDTLAGTSLFKNPRVAIHLGIICLSFLAMGFIWPSDGLFAQGKPAFGVSSSPLSGSPTALAAAGNPAAGGGVPVGLAPGLQTAPLPSVAAPLQGRDVRVYGEVDNGQFLRLLLEARDKSGRVERFRHTDLLALGYGIERVRKCVVKLVYQGQPQIVTCESFSDPPPVRTLSVVPLSGKG